MLRGLAFMLDRPFAAIGIQAVALLILLVVCVAAVALLFGIIFLWGVWQTGWMVGQTDKITHKVNTWHGIIAASRDVALVVVALLVLALAVLAFLAVRATLLEWSRVGNTMAVMLGFVALSFFSADSWHAAGALPGWRLITLIVVFSLFAFLVLYRQAHRAVAVALKPPISTADAVESASDPLVKAMAKEAGQLADAAAIPWRALVNLRFVAALLLGRRILVSGIVVSAALFLLGAIVISQQDTLTLMNVRTTAGLGFTGTFGIGSYQFFVSESLLKVSLLLGVIAAAYFVFANPDADKSQDLMVPRFIRTTIVLWACYQVLNAAADHPEQDLAALLAGSADR